MSVQIDQNAKTNKSMRSRSRKAKSRMTVDSRADDFPDYIDELPNQTHNKIKLYFTNYSKNFVTG